MRGNYTENICLNVRNTKGEEILSEDVHETIVCDMNIFGALGIAPIYTKIRSKVSGKKSYFQSSWLAPCALKVRSFDHKL